MGKKKEEKKSKEEEEREREREREREVFLTGAERDPSGITWMEAT